MGIMGSMGSMGMGNRHLFINWQEFFDLGLV